MTRPDLTANEKQIRREQIKVDLVFTALIVFLAVLVAGVAR